MGVYKYINGDREYQYDAPLHKDLLYISEKDGTLWSYSGKADGYNWEIFNMVYKSKFDELESKIAELQAQINELKS